ncbi:hypothetical protein HDU82_008707 [Entophlyctis luteolus]|nr:hypothetical protein HDU82_008707 [Entophlyctis luteolus]
MGLFPGVPCFMQLFEPRYRRMVSHILDYNRNKLSDDAADDDMIYGVVVKTPPPEADIGCNITMKRRRSVSDAALLHAKAVAVAAASSSAQARSDTIGNVGSASASYLGQCSIFSPGAVSSRRRLNGTSHSIFAGNESPWIQPSTRVGYTSEYLEFGTALKMRGLKPIYETTASQTQSEGMQINKEDSNTSTANSSNHDSESTASSGEDDDDAINGGDDDMDIEDDDWSSTDGEAMNATSAHHRRGGSRSSSRHRDSGGSTNGGPDASARSRARSGGRQSVTRSGHTLTQSESRSPAPPPPVVSRYLVDGVGAWRFRVLERGVCEDGLNLALVEKIEDLDFEDEDCVGNLVPTQNAGLAECQEEECHLPDCQCDSSRARRLLRDSEDAEMADAPPSSGASGHSSTATGSSLNFKARKLAARESDPYLCPASEFFKATGAQFRKLPPFPFDLSEASGIWSGLSSNDDVSLRRGHQWTGSQVASNEFAEAQCEYILNLHMRLQKLLVYTQRHLANSLNVGVGENSFFHFHLIHGDIPTTPGYLVFWLANLIGVHEWAKYELLRDDIGGVEGRIEWLLNVVKEFRRMYGKKDEGDDSDEEGDLFAKLLRFQKI